MENTATTALSKAILLLAVVLFSSAGYAEVRLPGFFGDHMVLQRDTAVPVWGWGRPGEAVTVRFAGQEAGAVTDEFGSWMVTLKPMEADSSGKVLSVNEISLKDVLVGEVWVCSGTDNMDLPVRKCIDSRNELNQADFPTIRLAAINRVQSPLPESDATARWQACTRESAFQFSAVGYFFARKLHQELGVPIGVIGASWGGTPLNPWIPAEGFRDSPSLKWAVPQIYNGRPSTEEGKAKWETYLKELPEWLPKAKKAIANNQTPTDRPAIPTELWITNIVVTKTFNGMINPLIPYGIRGVIWDHEENPRRPEELFHKQKALIDSWRKLWNQPPSPEGSGAPGGDFPFYFTEIANSGKRDPKPEGGDKIAQLREQQRRCLDIPNTGMAVTTDIGSEDKRAPQNKQDVGARLALLALANDYGKNAVGTGPMFKTIDIRGNEAHIQFDHVGNGLMVGKKKGLEPAVQADDELKGFAVAGSERTWHWAGAEIAPDGRTVVVSSNAVARPVAVRYAYRGNPSESNLYNREGLPAAPFRTDDW